MGLKDGMTELINKQKKEPVNEHTKAPGHILTTLVAAQWACTSLWFAINAVMPDLQRAFAWPIESVGMLTSALQLGFIAGTLVFALLALADRFSARRVFLICALCGASCTVAALFMVSDFDALLFWRFLTGFFLAGIYPVGMKIAAQWYPQGLGRALGYLVGALVLGSASPHALRAISDNLPWQSLMWAVAALAAAGGALLFFATPEPPVKVQRPATLQWRALSSIVTDTQVRSSAWGYFGHMWELYTLWVLLPVILAQRLQGAALSWATFGVLGSGALGCVLGGRLAQRWGSAKVAAWLLLISGMCCLLSPWAWGASDVWFGVWLLVWGITAAGDSPQFSALTALNAPAQGVGSVLTLVNSLGFAISIVSIMWFVSHLPTVPLAQLLPWLAAGPVLGLLAMQPLLRRQVAQN